MTSLTLSVLIPLFLGALGLQVVRFRKMVLLLGVLPSAVCCLFGRAALFHGTVLRLVGPLGVVILPDGQACLLILLSSLVGIAIWFHCRKTEMECTVFQPLAALLIASCNAVFLSYDLFNVYVCIELVTVLGFLLIRLEGGSRQIWAAVKYLLLGNLGMIIYLLAVVRVYVLSGDLGFGAVREIPLSLVSVLLAGLSVKGGLALCGLWLPESHGGAPSHVSALLSGVVVLSGVVPILRLAQVRLDLIPITVAMGTLSVFLGALLALRENDIKRMLACSTLSQLGYALIDPVAGAAFLLAHGLCKAWLFLVAGDLPFRRIDELRSQGLPFAHWLMLAFPSLILAGLPGFGVWATRGVILQVIGGSHAWLYKGASVLTALYLFRPLAGGPSFSPFAGGKPFLITPAIFLVSLVGVVFVAPGAFASLWGALIPMAVGALGACFLPFHAVSLGHLPFWERLDHLMGLSILSALILLLSGGVLS